MHVTGGMSLDAVKHWLADLLWERGHSADIFRIKGLLTIEGSDRRYVLQGICAGLRQLTDCGHADEPSGCRLRRLLCAMGEGMWSDVRVLCVCG